MKSSKTIITILVILLIAVSYYAFFMKSSSALMSLPKSDVEIDSLQFDPNPSVFILKDNNEWVGATNENDILENAKGVYAEGNNLELFLNAYEDLQAEDLLAQYETEAMEEAITLDEFREAVNSNEVLGAMNDVTSCRIMKRWLRKQKCKPKRKIYKQVVTKTKIGAISYAKGKIGINAPQIARFKDEIYRINVLMESFYNLRSSICDQTGWCYTNALLMACIPNNPAVNDGYTKCMKLITGEFQSNFVAVLKLFYENIEKFNDDKISEAEVKEVMKAELDKVALQLGEAEDEEEKDGEEENGEEDENGTETDSINNNNQ